MPDGQLEEGTLLNERYRILRVIGQGGMGTVYQAEHERLDAILAVKEIRGQAASGTAQQATMDQYQQEARFLVKLSHPNLPKVTDAFVNSDRFYLVMDFVEGVTLDARLRERGGKPLEAEQVVDWGIQIADVLAYLHSQEPAIIFRDLKPSNVMVRPDGQIKLIDFGIARRFQPGATKDTALLGSVGYSPPEQFGRGQTDTRSDIYAFGATLHHLLTARDPSTTPFKFPPVDQLNLAIPISLSRVVAQCVAMEPDLRPPDAGVVSADLSAIRDEFKRHAAGVTTGAKDASTSSRIVSAKLSEAEKNRSKSLPLRSLPPRSQTLDQRAKPADRIARIAVMSAGIVLVLGVIAYGIHSASARSGAAAKSSKQQDEHNVTPPTSTGGVLVTSGGSSGSVPSTTGQSSGTDPGTHTQPGGADPPSTSGSSPGPSPTAPDTKAASCRAEVVGTSPDGKALRLHITGEIRGKNNTGGMVAAYFYNADKSPLPAKDPQGSYATKTGQLYAEYTFQIDADSKPIDGTLDIPLDQFTSTTGVLYRCIVYADNQSAGQTELLALVPDTSVPSRPTQPGVRGGVANGA